MTVEKFIAKAQGYFGKYTAEQRSTVEQWLGRTKKNPADGSERPVLSERALGLVYSEVLKILSPAYKTPPGIYELEQAWRTVQKDRRHELYDTALPAPEEQPADEHTALEALAIIYETMGYVTKAKRVREGHPPDEGGV